MFCKRFNKISRNVLMLNKKFECFNECFNEIFLKKNLKNFNCKYHMMIKCFTKIKCHTMIKCFTEIKCCTIIKCYTVIKWLNITI